ncbi:hypothetical protein H9P43_000308 [Blastocladiella emersonii ATCC 22665]|nr:hypothetical protein H9P43_000308 [Blastocladiella emersonii ATCC 22665]
MSDSDDDYMSAAFLADPSPAGGAAAKPAHQLTYAERRKQALRAQERTQLSKQEQLAAAQKRKLDESNKGMQLLKKLGFREGGGLGKQGTGIAEPLAVTMRDRRLGIGVKTAEDLKVEHEMKRARVLEGKQDEFREWRASRFLEQQLEADVRKARKLAFEMDSKAEARDATHLWPLVAQPKAPPAEVPAGGGDNPEELFLAADSDNDDDEDDAPRPFQVSAAPEPVPAVEPVLEPPEPGHDNNEDDDAPRPWTESAIAFESLPPAEQLAALIARLRERYLYCIYCGCGFDTGEEMAEACPGPGRDDH